MVIILGAEVSSTILDEFEKEQAVIATTPASDTGVVSSRKGRSQSIWCSGPQPRRGDRLQTILARWGAVQRSARAGQAPAFVSLI